MNVSLSAANPLEFPVDLLALACDGATLADAPLLAALDERVDGVLRKAIAGEHFLAKTDQVLMLPTLGRLPASHVALVGVGARASLGPSVLHQFAGRASRLAIGVGATTVALVPPAPADATTAEAAAHALTLGGRLGGYRFDRYQTAEARRAAPATLALLLGSHAGSPPCAAAVARATRLAEAVARARDLVNEPAGVMTPSAMAAAARQIAAQHALGVTVLGPKECADRGMGLFLAVAQGSSEEPRFIHLSWKPAGATKRIVLVGKGVTFDSGGLSLKPNDSMLDMKTDMAGAAAVLSVMSAVAAEALPVEVHALAACTENMPSGRAYKLGDVLRSKAGKTVEINNTDAEGRLTLADAIAYGLELEPSAVLDFATLTGACVVALGPHIAGVMSNDDKLQGEWLAAAATAGEDMWPLPLPERLLEQLKSDIADMKNTGERWGGALTAGLFLKEFVGATPWVHVDIAGPSSASKDLGHVGKGGTGFAVATIFEYLRRVSAA